MRFRQLHLLPVPARQRRVGLSHRDFQPGQVFQDEGHHGVHPGFVPVGASGVLLQELPQFFRTVCQELLRELVALPLVARQAGGGQVGHPSGPSPGRGDDVVQGQRLLPLAEVEAPVGVPAEDIGPELPAVEGALLVFLTQNAGVFHQLDVELRG